MSVRGLTRIAPLLLAGCVGGAATAWSPISCSCLSAWEDVSSGLDHLDVRSSDQLTAPFIAGAIRGKFAGKPIQARDLPFATSTSDCKDGHGQDPAIRCTWWLWQSGLKKKGYIVTVQTDQQGIFRRVVVTPATSDGT